MLLIVGMCLHCRSLHQWWQTHSCIWDYWNILWYLNFKTWAILAPIVVYGCAGIMYAQMYVYNSLVPRPSHSFPSLAVQLAEEGLVYFLMWVTWRTDQIMRMWTSCESQTTSPTCISWSATILNRKIAVHKNYSRDSRRISHASTVGWFCHAKRLSNDTEYRALALARCCHAKPIHGACKRHTVQVSLTSIFFVKVPP